ncbi:MAG: endonuclease/exonuclease/phosphatase family protein [Candidatus Paceibacterota bacterium]
MTKINIVAINLQSGVGMTKGGFHIPLNTWKYWLPHSHKPISDAGEMIKDEGVDIACVTEITESSIRTGFRSQTDFLARKSGLRNYHFFSMQERGKLFFHEGNAILSKYKVEDADSQLLHVELQNMSLDEAVIEIEGQKITVFVAHLALLKRNREIQIREIIEIVKERKGPIILAGDFNEKHSEAFNILIQETRLKNMCNLKTFPSWNPKHTFDYIFLTEEFNVLGYHVQKSKAFSDHLALIVKAELR